MNQPRISVILPTLNQKQLTLKFLDSLGKQTYPQEKLEAVIIDNGSTDGTVEEVKKFKVLLIKNKKNLGFVKAVNQGIKKARGDLLFITNSDVLVDRTTFFEIVKYWLSDSRVGILGAKVFSMTKRSQVSGQDMPGFETDFFWGRPRSLPLKKLAALKKPFEVDWVSGSGMMVKKEVIDKIGLLDERFFAYWEDADFGVRAKKAGFKVVLVPQAKIYHQGSVVMGKEAPEKTYYLSRNNLLFLFKHTHPIGKLRLHLRNLVLVLFKLLKVTVGVKRKENFAFVAGILDFYQGKFGQRTEVSSQTTSEVV